MAYCTLVVRKIGAMKGYSKKFGEFQHTYMCSTPSRLQYTYAPSELDCASHTHGQPHASVWEYSISGGFNSNSVAALLVRLASTVQYSLVGAPEIYGSECLAPAFPHRVRINVGG